MSNDVSTNVEFMKEAVKLAEINASVSFKDGGPFGAVVVLNGKIIGRGINQVLINHDPTAHAEIQAIREACKTLNTHDLSKCILYTSCYPCPMCLSAILWSNIKKVYYGNTKEDAEDIGFRDDKFYSDLENILCGKDSSLELNQLSRDLTIGTFVKFKKCNGKLY